MDENKFFTDNYVDTDANEMDIIHSVSLLAEGPFS